MACGPVHVESFLVCSGPQLAYKQRKAGLTWCAGRWGQTQTFRFCTAGLGNAATANTMPLSDSAETLERTIGEAKTSRIMRGKFVVKYVDD